MRSDAFVYRVEILRNELFYGIRQEAVENQFNYCAADWCSVTLGDNPAEEEFDFCALDEGTGSDPMTIP